MIFIFDALLKTIKHTEIPAFSAFEENF